MLFRSAGASLLERSRARVVSFGSPVKAVPSEVSTTAFIAPAGLCGRVEARGGQWLFVEFPDGRAGWLMASDAGIY